MEKEIKNMQVFQWLLFGLCILNLILCISLFASRSKNNTSSESSGGTTEEPTTLDVSMMNTITTKEAVDLIEGKGKVVLFIGGSDCAFCIKFAPVLASAQEKYGFKANYIDITKMDKSSEEYKSLVKLMNVEETITINGEDQTKTLGEWLSEKGYTPTLAVFENGKMVVGQIGYSDLDSLSTLLEKVYK